MLLSLLLGCGAEPAAPPAGGDAVATEVAAPAAASPASAPTPMPAAAPLDPHARVVTIPAGPFVMGTVASEEESISASYGLKKVAYEAEEPRRTIELPAYRIDRYEVSMTEFRAFSRATGHAMPPALGAIDIDAYPMYPVMMVTWDDATAYCAWKGGRLPTEAEWEKAARGTDGRRFPWGNDYDATKANHSNEGVNASGHFPGDVSPYGVQDMAGNVSEWTSDWYAAYPGNENFDKDFGETHRVLRGGSWGGLGHYNLSYYSRTSYRQGEKPESRYESAGFRCAYDGEGAP